ncbi:unnamed protein product [Owenia fusiformis]|uniref:EGF-like domain-containing protein n=1 Tax=Owenia fusiformis TaxID=6347 RepID=A0A8S4NLC7_OWEFU|nr:unnamed protein product [Owenia fusiformis]
MNFASSFQMHTLLYLWITSFLLTSIRSVEHKQNLLWAQEGGDENSKIVAIQGSPSIWVPNRQAATSHITAPKSNWKFTALGSNFAQRTIFWADGGNKNIQGLQLNSGETSPFTVFHGTSGKVNGLTVDWLTNLVYWTDAIYNWIALSTAGKSQGHFKIIIKTGLDIPAAIVVHPSKGMLFWSDIGSNPKIERATLSGENRTLLVQKELTFPTGLSLDFDKNRLYWSDGGQGRIESVDLNGGDRRVVYERQGANYFGVAVTQDYIFATERNEKQLKVINKNTSLNELNFNLPELPNSVIVYDNISQDVTTSLCSNSSCDHFCVMTPEGESQCLCSDGFILMDDGTTCKGRGYHGIPQYIYSIGSAICRFPANLPDISMANISLSKQCFLPRRRNANTLGFNIRERAVYFTENDTRSLWKLQMDEDDNEKQRPKLVIGGLGQVEGIAVDWLNNHIYWTDILLRQIFVSNTDGSRQHILFQKDLEKPRGIAIDPIEKYMFWSDVGLSPKIERASLDGSERNILVGLTKGSPNHITLDVRMQRLYWTDSILETVTSTDYNGEGKKTIISLPQSNIFGITLFQDYILWTDQDSQNGLHIALIEDGVKIRGILHPGIGKAYDVITYDESIQPDGQSPCDGIKAKCKHLCLPNRSPSGFTCACAIGYTLHEDGVTCTSDVVYDNFILLTDTYHKEVFQLDLSTNNVQTIPLSGHGNTIAVTYDPKDFRIYWTDVTSQVIKRAFLNGFQEEVIMQLPSDSIADGLVVDPVSRLLFYTDTGQNIIAVMSLDGAFHKTLINSGIDEPRTIVLDPKAGYMYWTDWGYFSRIERADMNGENRVVLVEVGKGRWPNGLTIDTEAGQLYWCDARTDRIETADVRGRFRKVLLQEKHVHYFGLAVSEENIYFTDWTRKNVLKANKTDGSNIQLVGPPVFSRLNDIYIFKQSAVTQVENQCSVGNQCEQLCLPISTEYRFECACEDGTRLMDDKFSCSARQETRPTEVPTMAPTTVTSSTESPTLSETLEPHLIIDVEGYAVTNITITTTPNLQYITLQPTQSMINETLPTTERVTEYTYSTKSTSFSTEPDKDIHQSSLGTQIAFKQTEFPTTPRRSANKDISPPTTDSSNVIITTSPEIKSTSRSSFNSSEFEMTENHKNIKNYDDVLNGRENIWNPNQDREGTLVSVTTTTYSNTTLEELSKDEDGNHVVGGIIGVVAGLIFSLTFVFIVIGLIIYRNRRMAKKALNKRREPTIELYGGCKLQDHTTDQELSDIYDTCNSSINQSEAEYATIGKSYNKLYESDTDASSVFTNDLGYARPYVKNIYAGLPGDVRLDQRSFSTFRESETDTSSIGMSHEISKC